MQNIKSLFFKTYGNEWETDKDMLTKTRTGSGKKIYEAEKTVSLKSA